MAVDRVRVIESENNAWIEVALHEGKQHEGEAAARGGGAPRLQAAPGVVRPGHDQGPRSRAVPPPHLGGGGGAPARGGEPGRPGAPPAPAAAETEAEPRGSGPGRARRDVEGRAAVSATKPAWFAFPPHLEGLDRFEPGKPIGEVQRELGIADVIKLASNENPLGPSPKAAEAGRAAMADVNRYPDPQATGLRAALGAHLGMPVSHVVAGNGSVEIIDLIARAFLGPGDHAVISEHAFIRFRQIVAAHNHGARLVPMRDWTHDLAAMAKGDRRADAPRLCREPQQPHRHLEPPGRGRGARGRAAAGVPARPRRGLLRVHRRPGLPGRHRPRPPRGAADRHPHVLEGVRARGAPRRLRGGGAGGARGAARDPRGLRHELRGPGGGHRRPRRRRARAPLGGVEPGREGGRHHCPSWPRLRGPAQPRQLRHLRHPRRGPGRSSSASSPAASSSARSILTP